MRARARPQARGPPCLRRCPPPRSSRRREAAARGGARPSHLRRAGGGTSGGGAAAGPAHPAGAREPGRNRAARPERPVARRGRRQWERRGRRRRRSPGPGGDGRPRHEPRSRAPPCAARGPRRAASASPGPHPGAGDVLLGLRMMVDCQVSAPPGRDRPPSRRGWREDRLPPYPDYPAHTGPSREGESTQSARLRSSMSSPSWYDWETEARRGTGAGPGPTRSRVGGGGRLQKRRKGSSLLVQGSATPMEFPWGRRAPDILGGPLSIPSPSHEGPCPLGLPTCPQTYTVTSQVETVAYIQGSSGHGDDKGERRKL